jgi:hypothetical protein
MTQTNATSVPAVLDEFATLIAIAWVAAKS